MILTINPEHVQRAGRKWSGLTCPLAVLVNDQLDPTLAYAHIAKGQIRIIRAGQDRQRKKSVIWSTPMTADQARFACDFDTGLLDRWPEKLEAWIGLTVEIPDILYCLHSQHY